jgi:hypothetical protein
MVCETWWADSWSEAAAGHCASGGEEAVVVDRSCCFVLAVRHGTAIDRRIENVNVFGVTLLGVVVLLRGGMQCYHPIGDDRRGPNCWNAAGAW